MSRFTRGIRARPDWEIPEHRATPEGTYHNRRQIIAALGLGAVLAPTLLGRSARAAVQPNPAGAIAYPGPRNEKYRITRPLTPQKDAITYNNFYEFGSHKNIADAAQALPIDPWSITIDGLVEAEQTLSFDALMRKVAVEERLYRHRCVEAWAMTVPWSGFPMHRLVELARPKSGAKFIAMQTLADESVMPGLKSFWYPWPYTEGVSMAEARNDLAFIATGLYGEAMPKQNGAPLRLVLPWKYGFKSIKSIVRFTFTDRQPVSFWEELAPNEYGFYANVNPDVAHPRWSQASERLLGTDERVPTQIYNGYGAFVADMYTDLATELGPRLYR